MDVSEPHIEIYVENLQFWRRVTPIFRTFSSISVFYIGFLSVIFFPVFLVKVNYSMKYCMSEFLFCFRPPWLLFIVNFDNHNYGQLLTKSKETKQKCTSSEQFNIYFWVIFDSCCQSFIFSGENRHSVLKFS